MSRERVSAVILALMVAGSACGLPTDDRPRVIRPETVPYNLIGESESETDAPDLAPGAEYRSESVYLVDASQGQLRLVPQPRKIMTPVNLTRVIDSLMAGGLTDDEKAMKLANYVPGKELVSVDRVESEDETTAIIDVREDFFTRLPRGTEGRAAIAQIVFTATAFDPGPEGRKVKRVKFTVDGEQRQVATATGNRLGDVEMNDFREFLPPEAGATPASPASPTNSPEAAG